MFGGWRNHYTIGYNLPSATYLAKDGSSFKLEAPATTELYDNFVIENVKVTFVLPEGVQNVKIDAGFDFTRSEDSTRYSKNINWLFLYWFGILAFLDTSGRILSGLTASHLTGDHASTITVTYEWNSLLIFKEPLLAIAGWLVFFSAIVVIARLDFSIKAKTE